MMRPYEHGGDVYSNKILYDFSANINPLGMPDAVKTTLREHMELFENYPDPECRALVKQLALHEKVPASYIVCGNGAAELLYQILQVKQPKRVLLPVPSFVEYEKAILEYGGEIVYYERKKELDFQLDAGILTMLQEQGADSREKTDNSTGKKPVDMLILCNPNNPTGDLISPSLMARILTLCEAMEITLVVDECFLEFTEEAQGCRLRPDKENLIIVKAFTKLYAMAGLRLGYLLCADTAFNRQVKQTGQCWNVSVPAQLAGVAALGETDYVKRTKQLIRAERQWLSDNLQALGLKVYAPAANFLFFYSDRELWKSLLDFGIAIRDCGNYHGLGHGYYRIAVRTHDENVVLVEKIKEIFAGKGAQSDGKSNHDTGNDV